MRLNKPVEDYCVKVHSCLLPAVLLPADALLEHPVNTLYVEVVSENKFPLVMWNKDSRTWSSYCKYPRSRDGSLWYKPLSDKCSCKKMITKSKRDELINQGVAERVLNNKIKQVLSCVWMAQQIQVPRVDLISQTDIERMVVDQDEEAILYVEEVHKLYMENRAKLIVPFREDPTDGQLLFPFGPDQRTRGGYSK